MKQSESESCRSPKATGENLRVNHQAAWIQCWPTRLSFSNIDSDQTLPERH